MPLKKADIKKFKERLEDLKQEILHALEGANSEVRAPDESKGYSQHQADEGTDDFNRTISLEVTGKEYEILRQIERALEKVEEDSYGICDLTEEEIPVARLEALPYATMTVKAQEQLERKSRRYR